MEGIEIFDQDMKYLGENTTLVATNSKMIFFIQMVKFMAHPKRCRSIKYYSPLKRSVTVMSVKPRIYVLEK